MRVGATCIAVIKAVGIAVLAVAVLIVGIASLVVVAALAALAFVPALLLVAGMRRPTAPVALAANPVDRVHRAG